MQVGGTIVCIASGPSLTAADVRIVRRWRSAAPDRHVIAVNNCWQLAPWADAVFACNRLYWAEYVERIRAACRSELWTSTAPAATRYGLSLAPIERGGGSGCLALRLALYQGAARVVLLGYDMAPLDGRLHWHPDHGDQAHRIAGREIRMSNPGPAEFRSWIGAFNALASPVPIINCSRHTALTCFPRMSLAAALPGTENFNG